jgi:glutaredoxin
MNPIRPAALACATLLSLLISSPAFALYKVVGPDGKVSYTDRPPVGVENKIQPMNAPQTAGASDPMLPIELRQAVQRFPVTLYVTGDCGPCETGRQQLRERGVPFTEKTVITREDSEALQKQIGSRDLPVLTVGGQTVRGYLREDWTSYLDAAGYPKESRLPANFQQSAATPLVASKPTPAAAPARAAAPSPAAPAPAPSGFRF